MKEDKPGSPLDGRDPFGIPPDRRPPPSPSELGAPEYYSKDEKPKVATPGPDSLVPDGTESTAGGASQASSASGARRSSSAGPSATAAGTFSIGGDITVNRLGFGAMRVTGKGIWGPPSDPAAARATLRRLPQLDINLVDTADAYGPFVSEDLLREVLHPYKGMLIATKGGLTRSGPNGWRPLGRPEYLRQCVMMSLRRLGLDRIDLWQLHRIDPRIPRREQFEVIAEMRKEGLIRHVGLSEVGVEEIEEARKCFPVATVQNEYSLSERRSEAVLDYCEQHGIGFIPWAPLGSSRYAKAGTPLMEAAHSLDASPGQVALAWLLMRSPVVLPIPGTSRVDHLVENVAAAALELTQDLFRELDDGGKSGRQDSGPGLAGSRAPSLSQQE